MSNLIATDGSAHKATEQQQLLADASHQRHYGTASGVAGLIGAVVAGLAAPVAGVAIGLVGAVLSAKMLFNAEGKEKQAKELEQE